MKKILVVALVAVMCLGLFACAPQEQTNGLEDTYWEIVKMTSKDGQTVEGDILSQAFGGKPATMKLNADETLTLYMGETELEGTWTFTDDVFTMISSTGVESIGALVGDELTVKEESGETVYVKVPTN